jgi:parallel beta-helix repeat protein
MKRMLFLTGLVLVLVSVFLLAFDIETTDASGTIYIEPDGSIDPPDAPFSTVDNVTYTLTGNITSDGDGIIVERDNIVIDGSGYTLLGVGRGNGIDLVGASNVTLRNVGIREFINGVYFSNNSNHNSITGSNIANNINAGVLFANSAVFFNTSCNIMSGNNIENNGYCGIMLGSSSNSNSMSGNNITNNGYGGIVLNAASNSNSMSGNNITNNGYGGIVLHSSSNNRIDGNNIASNNRGILLDPSSEFYYCSNNTIYHNNLINNTIQVDDLTLEHATFWDNGCEGNYWSNYNGTDLDNDGVGDDYLPWEGVDTYPLVNVYWNPCDISHDLKVDMRDISISAKAFGTRSGDVLWNAHADITGPEPLVSDGKIDMRDISLVSKHFAENYL